MTRAFEAKAPSTVTTKRTAGLALTISYFGLLLFTIAYYNRPQDYFSIGTYLPFALIGGALAVGAYVIHLAFGGQTQRQREATVVIALLGWFLLSIPFANWAGGSFDVVKDNISKVLILTIVVMNVTNTMSRLRKLLVVQTLSVALMAWIAHSNFDATGRAIGNNSTFGNSNDLAVLLCINLPLMFFFVIEPGNRFRKLFYAAVMLLGIYTVLLTYSRTGFLSMAVSLAIVVWDFGIKRGHYYRVIVCGVLLMLVFAVFMPSGYDKLIASIYSSDVDTAGTARSDAAVSAEQRWQIMIRAAELSFRHPLLGVGPNGFAELSGYWRVEHNTYLQLSTEAGLPSLFLFLLLIRYTFLNLRDAERRVMPQTEVWRLIGALRASLWAFLIGAFFINFAYTFFPYFLLGFVAAIHQIALNNSDAENTGAGWLWFGRRSAPVFPENEGVLWESGNSAGNIKLRETFRPN